MLKSSIKMLLITICLLFLSGCAGQKEKVTVHSEEEMRTYALTCLKNKYGKDFEIEEDDYKYGYWDKKRKDFLYMTGWVHVVDDEETRCVFKVKEPNDFSDNFEINYYKDAIESDIRTSWSDLSSDYQIEIDHGLSDKKFDPEMDYKKYLYSSQTTIRIIARAEATDHPEEYVPLIRAWMEKLYPADFNWYFELRDKENDELRYFTLAPGDNGFDSTDNWSDEMIARYIADNIAFYHMKEDK